MAYAHDSGLILASIIVSQVAAFTGLALTNKIGGLPVSRRKTLIVMAAFVLGGGIWSMHFVAMLAHRFQVPVHYDLLQTLGSALVAVLVVGLALLLLHFAKRSSSLLTFSGLLLGAGIVSMHFIGMLGMRGVIPVFASWAVVCACIVAAVMGVLAIRVSYGNRSNKSILLGGFLFGFSVVLVHFTAMAGTNFSLDPVYAPTHVVLNPNMLAVVVTVTAFVICGTFLLAASTFLMAGRSATGGLGQQPGVKEQLPHSQAATSMTAQRSTVGEARGHSGNRAVEALIDTADSDAQAVNAVASQAALQTMSDPTPISAIAAPVAEVQTRDADDPRDALQEPEATTAQQAEIDAPAAADGMLRVPFERNKRIEFVSSSEIAAVRADGRYTHLYTQEGVRFCPWSIADAEKRLIQEHFFRSHRSYLVNLQAVSSFEKKRDAGQCKFEGFPQLSTVPVSRARVSQLLQLLGL